MSFFCYVSVLFMLLYVVFCIIQDFGNYDQYAPVARREVELLHSRRGDILAQAVSTATGQLLGSVREELQSVKTQLITQEVALRHTVIMVQDLCSTLRSTVQQSVSRQDAGNRMVLEELKNITKHQKTLQDMLDDQQQQQVRHRQIEHQRETLVFTGGIDDNAIVLGVDDVETTVTNNDPPLSFLTRQARLANSININPVDLLLSSARLPSCNTKFPESWESLYNEWNDNDLESFVKSRQQEWKDKKLIQRYSKRLRAMKIIKKTMTTMGNGRFNALEVCNSLDFDRLRDGHTLSKHIHLLFNQDATRNRRTRHART